MFGDNEYTCRAGRIHAHGSRYPSNVSHVREIISFFLYILHMPIIHSVLEFTVIIVLHMHVQHNDEVTQPS